MRQQLDKALNDSDNEAAWKGPLQCQSCVIRERHLVLFSDLQPEDFALIQERIDERRYQAGEALYLQGEPATHVFTVRHGVVKLVKYSPQGEQRIVRLLRQGDVAALEALVDQPYQHNAVALEPVLACRIPISTVQRLSQRTPRLHRQLLSRWQRAIDEAENWLIQLSTGTAQVKVARLLVYLVADRPDPVCQLPSREEIGAILGITTETASRVMAEFKRAGWIKRLYPKHVWLDVEALQVQAAAG